MATLRDLVEEGKRRAVAVAICVLAVAYCMTLPSSSVWINIPVALCAVAGLRYLVLQLEIRWRVPEQEGCSVWEAAARRRQTRSRNGGNAGNAGHGGTEGRWRRAVDSPVVEAAIEEFTNCVVNEWVLQLWFSALSPDLEVPEEIRLLLNGVIGEVAQRARKVNLVSLLTRDVVDLAKGQLELFRRTQSRVGADVLARLPSEKRDERLKQSLVASRELHPALVSADAEYEVLRRLMGEVVDLVLRPQDKQNKLVRGLARELLGCAVMRPIVNLANPGLINQVIEGRVLAARNKVHMEQPLKSTALPVKLNKLPRTVSDDLALEMSTMVVSGEVASPGGQAPAEVEPAVVGVAAGASAQGNRSYGGPRRQSSASKGWARTVDVASNKKTQVLAPEHLDNMWTKGRNYKKREVKSVSSKAAQLVPIAAPGKTQELEPARTAWEQVREEDEEEVVSPASTGSRTAPLNVVHSKQNSQKTSDQKKNVQTKNGPVVKPLQGPVGKMLLDDNDEEDVPGIGFAGAKWNKATGANSAVGSHVNVEPLKVSEAKKHPLSFFDDIPLSADHASQSQSQRALQSSLQHRRTRSGSGLDSWQRGLDHQDGHWNSSRSVDANVASSNMEGQGLSLDKPGSVRAPEEAGYGSGSMSACSPDKFLCKVVGYHIVKDVQAKPFVVYTISVRDSLNRIWKVQRRFSNFEKLHRRLKEIPYYDLNLPPKRYLSSNMDDAFILERCQLLDVYLQELLSRPSISEQHEVWDFLSKNSVNYGFDSAASIMKTLAGNVDDAVDDVFRHIRWVSDDLQEVFKTAAGIKKRVNVGSTSLVDSSFPASDLPQTLLLTEAAYSERGLAAHMLDEEDLGDLENRPPPAQYDGAYSDSELPSRSFSQNQTGRYQEHRGRKTERALSEGHSPVESLGGSDTIDDELGIPQEWAPPKLSVPLLNLVDAIFQLQARGWIRRQVFWMAKEALQLVMGDTLDDWLLSRIQWLRKEEVVASGISWVRGILWRDGLFITKRNAANNSTPRANNGPGSMGQPQPQTFEQQREAARRKEVVREVLIDNAPIALVSLIGRKEYQRCAKDIFYFLQSPLFVKQLGFSLLEILILAAFPELHDVVLDVRSSVL